MAPPPTAPSALPPSGDAARPPALGCLGAALLAAGGVPLIALFTAWTLPYRLLRVGFGALALPIALAAVVSGVWLVRRRQGAVQDVPWGRALAVEAAGLAALALLSAANGSAAIGDWAPAAGSAGR